MFSSIFQDTKERTDFFIAIAVVALFGIFIVSQFIEDDLVDVDSLEALITQTDDTADSAPSLVSIKEETVPVVMVENQYVKESQTPPREDSFISVATKDSIVADSIAPPIESLTSDVQTDTSIVEQTTTKIKEQTADIASSTIVEDEPSASVIEKNTSTPVAPPTSTSVVENIIEGKDCRIIIGSYRLKSSRDSMLEKLAKTDFQVVTYREKGLNIVAIHHSCDKEALRSTIKTVREKFAKGAFITGK